MNLSEMYEEMQKRYDVDAEEERKTKEADNNILKGIICELIDKVRHELEDNMQEVIYQKFCFIRRIYIGNVKKLKTSLICELTDGGFYLRVCVNCHNSSYNDEHGDARKIDLDTDAMTRLTQFFVEHYKAEDDSIKVTFEFSLDDNTVTITWDFEGNTWKLKQDFKEIFPKGSVHRSNKVDRLVLNLD